MAANEEQKYSVGLELFAKHVRDTGFVSALSSLNWLQIVLKYFAKNLFIWQAAHLQLLSEVTPFPHKRWDSAVSVAFKSSTYPRLTGHLSSRDQWKVSVLPL